MTWREIIKLRRKHEKKFKASIQRALMEDMYRVLDELNEYNVMDIANKIPALVGNQILKNTLIQLYKDTGWDFYQVVKFKKDDLERSLWDENFERYVAETVGTHITLIDGFTKEYLMNTVREIVKKGTEQGYGVAKIERILRAELKTQYAAFTRSRSLRIVQTEVMTASNQATLKAGNDSGLMMRKIWLTAPYGLSKTERHNLYSELKEQRPMKGQDFQFGNYYMAGPGDPKGGPENVINCKCALAWEQLEF